MAVQASPAESRLGQYQDGRAILISAKSCRLAVPVFAHTYSFQYSGGYYRSSQPRPRQVGDCSLFWGLGCRCGRAFLSSPRAQVAMVTVHVCIPGDRGRSCRTDGRPISTMAVPGRAYWVSFGSSSNRAKQIPMLKWLLRPIDAFNSVSVVGHPW